MLLLLVQLSDPIFNWSHWHETILADHRRNVTFKKENNLIRLFDNAVFRPSVLLNSLWPTVPMVRGYCIFPIHRGDQEMENTSLSVIDNNNHNVQSSTKLQRAWHQRAVLSNRKEIDQIKQTRFGCKRQNCFSIYSTYGPTGHTHSVSNRFRNTITAIAMFATIGLVVAVWLLLRWLLKAEPASVCGIYSRPGKFYYIKFVCFYLLVNLRQVYIHCTCIHRGD